MNSKAWLPALLLVLLGGCQKDINHRPANIAVTSLVSLGDRGIQGNGASTLPSVTPDGRYVVFASTSTNLISGIALSHQQIYRRDFLTGSTILVSTDDAGVPGDQDSTFPSISADGTRIAFQSLATNFSPDANPFFVADVYVRDLSVNPPVTILLSGAAGGGPNDSMSSGAFAPAISQNGAFVVFISDASTVTNPSTGPDFLHCFRRSIDAAVTELVDLQPGGSASGTANMIGASISADGRYVAFDSTAKDLGGQINNGTTFSVYVRDMTTTINAVVLASVSLDPSMVDPASEGSFLPSISADGHVVAFESFVQNLVPDDLNGPIEDIFVCDLHDPLNPRTTLVSRRAPGFAGSLESTHAAIAPDGGSVAFLSLSPNLVDDDFNGKSDVFWYHLTQGKLVRVSVNTAQQEALGSALAGFALTGDGRTLLFADEAPNLVTEDANGNIDVFTRGPLY